jgi:hypothetical protein
MKTVLDMNLASVETYFAAAFGTEYNTTKDWPELKGKETD